MIYGEAHFPSRHWTISGISLCVCEYEVGIHNGVPCINYVYPHVCDTCVCIIICMQIRICVYACEICMCVCVCVCA